MRSDTPMYNLAVNISNSLSVSMIIMCMAVVMLWHRPAINAIKSGIKTHEAWFIIGVYAGFGFEIGDSSYWLFPWTASALESPYSQPLFEGGVFPNIVFRQCGNIFAAYCHIRSALEYHGSQDPNHSPVKVKANKVLGVSIVIGIIYSSFIMGVLK